MAEALYLLLVGIVVGVFLGWWLSNRNAKKRLEQDLEEDLEEDDGAFTPEMKAQLWAELERKWAESGEVKERP